MLESARAPSAPLLNDAPEKRLSPGPTWDHVHGITVNASDYPVSRRDWLERVSGPALVASLGAGLLGPSPAHAQPAATDDRLLGARVYNVRDFGAKGDGTALDTAAVQAASTTPSGGDAPPPGAIRNISFNGIRAYVTAEGQQFADMHWKQDYRDGERRTCITLNGVGEKFLENIGFTDVHVTYEGGGTAEEAAIRDVPQIAGEYFQIGPRPAYALYVRNVRGLTLHNVRFDFTKPDLRPAVVFDHVSDASVNGLTAKGHPEAESLLRFIDSRDVLVTGARVLASAKVFLRLEGTANEAITIDGGDIAKAGKPIEVANGAREAAVKVRA